MKLCAVVAASDNQVIGRDGALPWHLPADLAHFKRVTMGHPVLMGRRTFESIGRPLPGRRNLVLSRSGFSADGVETVGSLEEARGLSQDASHLMIIGGADVFALALPKLDLIYLTRVHAQVPGDVFMPALDMTQWSEIERQERPADERNAWPMSFLTLERRQG